MIFLGAKEDQVDVPVAAAVQFVQDERNKAAAFDRIEQARSAARNDEGFRIDAHLLPFGLPVLCRMEDLRIHGVVDLYDAPAGKHAAFFHLLPEPPGGGYKSQGTDAAECFFFRSNSHAGRPGNRRGVPSCGHLPRHPS